METKYSCPHCHQHVALAAPTPGLAIQCPNCGVSFALTEDSRGGRGLGSPWIWCLGALIAIGITYPLLFNSAPARPKIAEVPTVTLPKAPSNLSAATFQFEDKGIDQWIEDLKNLDSRVSDHAKHVIREHGDELKPELIRIIQAPQASGKHRGHAVEALGYLLRRTDPEIKLLLDMLTDRDKDVRAGTSTALRRMRMDAPVVVPVLIEMADSPDSGVRQTAAIYFADLGASAAGALPAVQKLVEDPNLETKKHAVVALSRLAVPTFKFANPRLTTAVMDLGNYDLEVQSRAEVVLKEIGLAAIPELVAVLQNPHAAALDRSLAAKALGLVGGHGEFEIKALFEAAKDPEIIVRSAAISSVGLLNSDPKILVPLCVDLLSDSDGGMRRRSARILGHLGDAAREAIPELKRMAGRDPDRLARSAAMDTLRKLGVSPSGAGAKKSVN